MSQVMLELLESKRAIDKAIKERAAVVKKAFHEEIKKVMASHPIVERISWVQYAPHFNDGDTCEFSKHDNNIVFNVDGKKYYFGDDFSDGDYEDEEDPKGVIYEHDEKWRMKWLNKEAKAAYDDINSFMAVFTDDDFEELFGDDKEITITQKNIRVSDHDHD